jgi:hypothetical protein
MLKLNRSGVTIVEAFVAMMVGGIGLLAVSELINNFYQSQKNVRSALDLSQFESNVRALLTNKEASKQVLGGGYINLATAANANQFNPTFPDPQPTQALTFHNTNGTGVMYAIGTQVSPDYRIRDLYIKKRDNPPGSGDMKGGAMVKKEIRTGPTSIQSVVRRGVLGQIVFELQNVPASWPPGPPPNPSPNPPYPLTGPLFVTKTFDISFLVETIDNDGDGAPDNLAAFPWRIASSVDALETTAIGHQSTDPNGTVPPDCTRVNSGLNDWAKCPAGNYVMSQMPEWVDLTVCVGCMKGSVCCYPNSAMRNSVLCCPIPK